MKNQSFHKNELFSENRVGRFSIHRRVMVFSDSAALRVLFGMMIVVRADSDFQRDSVDYIAYSPLFPSVPLAVEPPLYSITANMTNNKSVGFTVEPVTDPYGEYEVSIRSDRQSDCVSSIEKGNHYKRANDELI